MLLRRMTDEELVRAKELLDCFGVDYSGDTIELDSSCNSCIINPNTKWQEFLGDSIASIAKCVAEMENKKIKWIDEYNGL